MKITIITFFFIISINFCAVASNIDNKHSHENALQQDLRAQAASVATVPAAKKVIPPRVKRSFDLVKPIPPVFTRSRKNNESEKVALFEQTVAARPVSTLRLYEMAHDPVIKNHIRRDVKRESELHALRDAHGQTILMRAIDNNDAEFVSNQCMGTLNAEQKKTAFLDAGRRNRPRVMLALIERRKYESEEAGVYRAIAQLNDIPQAQIPMQAIHSILDLVDRHKIDRATYDQKLYKVYQKTASLIYFKNDQQTDHKVAKEFPFEAMNKEELERMRKLGLRYNSKKVIQSPDLHNLIAHMLMPRRSMMVPELETAIQTGNVEQVDALLAQGCSVNDRNSQGLDAVELAAHCGQNAMLSNFLDRSIYISEQKKQDMIKAAQAQKTKMLFNEKLTHKQAGEYQKKYDAVVETLNNNPLEQKRVRLRQSIDQNNIGDFVATLASGADPNAMSQNGNPLSMDLMQLNPLFFKIIFRFGSNPNVLAMHGGTRKLYTLFDWVLDENNPALTEQLVIAGVDLLAPTNIGTNLEQAISRENPEHLKVILFPKNKFQERLNPNITLQSDDRSQHSLLYVAFWHKKPQIFKLLADAGADPNALHWHGYPIALDFVKSEDSAYLKTVLNPRTNLAKKLDPNMMVSYSDGTQNSLLRLAMRHEKPNNFKELLKAGADPNLIASELIINDDHQYLAMALDQTIPKRLDPNLLYTDSRGILCPLIDAAMRANQSQNFKLLLDAGADANACDSNGDPIAYFALFFDPQYLEMLLKSGLNPQTTKKDDGGGFSKYSLVTCARWKNKPEHMRLLQYWGGSSKIFWWL